MNAEVVYAILLNKIRKISGDIQNIANPLIYRGNVQNESSLPSSPKIGDMYNITSKSSYGEAGMNVAWNGEIWDSMGPTIDMNSYYSKVESDAKYAPIVNQILMSSSDTSVNLEQNTFYIFPEMSSLTISLTSHPTGCYHFRFTSGPTATTLILPDSVKSDLSVEPNRTYEISIFDNLLAWTSWVV